MIQKTKSIRELGSVDIAELQRLVSQLSEDVWNAEDERKENRFFCFNHTRHIVFQFISGGDPRNSYCKPIWNFWKNKVLPIMDAVTEIYGYQQQAYAKVMLARLAAGHAIDRHRDQGLSNHLTHKIHVPLQTNSQTKMFIKPDEYHLETGRAYEVNNLIGHGVENNGDTDRVHLIFECFDPLDTDLLLRVARAA